MLHKPELRDPYVNIELLTVQSLWPFLCSQEVPYSLRNSLMVCMPSRWSHGRSDGTVDGSKPMGQRFLALHLASSESGTLSKPVIQGPSTTGSVLPERNSSPML